MGRAGRFGTKGLAITFVSSASDSEVLNQVESPDPPIFHSVMLNNAILIYSISCALHLL